MIGWLLLAGVILLYRAFIILPQEDRRHEFEEMIAQGRDVGIIEIIFHNSAKRSRFPASRIKKAAWIDIDKIMTSVPIYKKLLDGTLKKNDPSITKQISDANARFVHALGKIAKQHRYSMIFRQGPMVDFSTFSSKYKEFPDVTALIIEEMS